MFYVKTHLFHNKKFLVLVLLLNPLLWVACSTPKKLAHQPLSSETNFRKINTSGIISYSPDRLTVSSHDGFMKDGNSVKISLDGDVIAQGPIKQYYSVAESISNFLNLKISEAKAKNKKILVDHDKLLRITTTDGTGGAYSGHNENIFLEFMMIEGLRELPVTGKVPFYDKYGIILEPQRISLQHEENLVGRDDLLILVDGKAIVSTPVNSEIIEVILNSFENLRKRAMSANESIRFNLFRTFSFIYAPNDFMNMFRLESSLGR